ncbi:hypothetical protein HMPREF0005_02849 [Achromobacter xylosoxidans C54]|uniref:dATP/dGTP pyrophosphohydrolase domain-containing protein n=1 Tax=Alcaligenes xylosoxydans xylosoxydans TaxID=85698 RepID=UPI0001F435D8|nr:dATP/dGTP pyrophosphohydrolase domain-containing protein [Achromobacter xylosoxidans]EFV84107.1 hypothetical protein HMPREF0005_02849 [Achromobacter xylosoxidans C54]
MNENSAAQAVQEAERIAAADEYFQARTWIMDTNDNRRIFEAGFDRAYALLSQVRAPVAGKTRESVDYVRGGALNFDAHPDGAPVAGEAVAWRVTHPRSPKPGWEDATREQPPTLENVKQQDPDLVLELAYAAPQARPSDDKLWDQTLTERDEYHDMADKLANAIADHLLIEIGEHSSSNCPWMRALEAIENAAPQASAEAFDFVAHLARQAEFSARTFGPGARVAGVCDHIRKELIEVETSGGDLKEWVDVIILGLDGAWRSGATPQEIIAAIVAKQAKNEARTWPDWRTMDPNKAIEHQRNAAPRAYPSGDGPLRNPCPAHPEGGSHGPASFRR